MKDKTYKNLENLKYYLDYYDFEDYDTAQLATKVSELIGILLADEKPEDE